VTALINTLGFGHKPWEYSTIHLLGGTNMLKKENVLSWPRYGLYFDDFSAGAFTDRDIPAQASSPMSYTWTWSTFLQFIAPLL
jgi:hypothetical protein